MLRKAAAAGGPVAVLAYFGGMLAEATTAEPRHAQRRYAHGELLLAAFIAARRPLAFEDLVSVLVDTGACVSDLVTWMASSQANGLISPEGYETCPNGRPVGSRLFTLSDEARSELRARRSRRRMRVAVA